MRTKLTLLAIGLAAMFAAAPTQAALDEGGGAARTPAVASTAGSFTASTVRSDAVMAWNANAGKAAIAACISPVDNPLHESHLYAMTHVAIHDALNAIDRRSRPYAFTARVKRGASPEAAVAAAAHDVHGSAPQPDPRTLPAGLRRSAASPASKRTTLPR